MNEKEEYISSLESRVELLEKSLAANYRFKVKVQVYDDGAHTITIIN